MLFLYICRWTRERQNNKTGWELVNPGQSLSDARDDFIMRRRKTLMYDHEKPRDVLIVAIMSVCSACRMRRMPLHTLSGIKKASLGKIIWIGSPSSDFAVVTRMPCVTPLEYKQNWRALRKLFTTSEVNYNSYNLIWYGEPFERLTVQNCRAVWRKKININIMILPMVLLTRKWKKWQYHLRNETARRIHQLSSSWVAGRNQ